MSEWNPQLALLMAVETYRRDPGFEGLNALQRVLVDASAFLGVVGSEYEYRDVHWVTDDRLLAVTDTEVHLLVESTGDLTVLPIDVGPSTAPTVEGSRTPPIGIRASSPAGVAAIADESGDLLIVDVSSGTVELFPAGHQSQAVAITADGSTIALGFADGRLDLFDLASRSLQDSVMANPARDIGDLALTAGVFLDDRVDYQLEGVSGVAFDSTGRRLVSVGGVYLRSWNVEDLSPTGPEIVHSSGADLLNLFVGEPRNFWFEADDPDVVVVTGDASVVRWRMSTGNRDSISAVPQAASDAGGIRGGG